MGHKFVQDLQRKIETFASTGYCNRLVCFSRIGNISPQQVQRQEHGLPTLNGRRTGQRCQQHPSNELCTEGFLLRVLETGYCKFNQAAHRWWIHREYCPCCDPAGHDAIGTHLTLWSDQIRFCGVGGTARTRTDSCPRLLSRPPTSHPDSGADGLILERIRRER